MTQSGEQRPLDEFLGSGVALIAATINPAHFAELTALNAIERLEQREVRSYEIEHVLQLLHLDFHHG